MCGFSYVNVFMNLCLYVRESDRERRVRERPTAAKTRSPDIIEDDISDYPKDRNSSLSKIFFQLFYCPAFSRVCSFEFCQSETNKLCFYMIEVIKINTNLLIYLSEVQLKGLNIG